jgi:hypothetical protein
MRSFTAALAVPALVFCLVPIASAQNENAAERTGDSMRRTADRMTAGSTTQPGQVAPDADDIREIVAQITQAAATKSGLDDLVERFASSDRKRLENDSFLKQDHSVLDGRIAEFQKDWKARYNEDFKIHNANKVLGDSFAMVLQHRLGDEARLASERMGGNPNPPINTNRDANGNRDIAANERTGDISGYLGDNTDLKPGESVATVDVASMHNLPYVRVPLVHQLPDSWRIDVPNTLTAQQLHDNILKQLTAVDEAKDRWPADVNDAYRLVAHRITMAVMNVDEPSMNRTDMNRP